MCGYENRFAAPDGLEKHLAEGHYRNCRPYPCLSGCRGEVRFRSAAALRDHCVNEHYGLTDYEVG